MDANLPDGALKVIRHPLQALQHARHALRMVLKIAEHLCEICRPRLQLANVRSRYAQQFCSYRGRKRLGEIRDDIHAAFVLHFIQQRRNNIFDVPPQGFHSIRGKDLCRQAPQPGVSRRIHEKHLLHHHLGDGIE